MEVEDEMELTDDATTDDEGGRGSAKAGSRPRLMPRAEANKRKVEELFDLRHDRCALLASTESTSSTLTQTTKPPLRWRLVGTSQTSAERSKVGFTSPKTLSPRTLSPRTLSRSIDEAGPAAMNMKA